MPLTVIIVSWNVKQQLALCLRSVYRSSRQPKSVIVVDNASSDNSVDQVRADFPLTTLIANHKNLGFAAAVNQGLSKSRSDFYLMLNPDCYLNRNTLEVCFNVINSNRSIGVLGCQSRNIDGSIQPTVRRFPHIGDQSLVMLGLQRIWPNCRVVKKYLMSDFDNQGDRSVDQIQGSFFMISAKALEQVGRFDERYFVWFEEVDYCRRVKGAGLNVFFTAQTHVTHQGAASFSQLSPFKKRQLFTASLIKYFDKFQPGWRPWLLRILWPLSMLVAIGLTMVKLKRK